MLTECSLPHLTPTTALGGQSHSQTHFVDEGNDAWWDPVMSPRSHTWGMEVLTAHQAACASMVAGSGPPVA